MTTATRSGPVDLYVAIRQRAEEIYVRSGRSPGRDLENWAQAEQEIQQESSRSEPRRAVVVKLHGVQYVGEYTPESSLGYLPGEFGRGVMIPVRFEGDKMFVTRSNGLELETTVIQKVG